MRSRMRRFNGGQRFRDPRSLFMGGAQGFWLDMTDPATWFQNSDGTTPATTLGDPVGFVLDKSGQGYNAIQETSAARPTHGRMPYGGVRNQITYSEDLSNASWAKSNLTVSANAAIAPDGTMTADLVYPTTSGSYRYLPIVGVSAALTTTRTLDCTVSIFVEAAGISWVNFVDGNAGSVRASFNVAAGSVGTVTAGYSATITLEPEGYYRCSVYKTGGWGASATPGFCLADGNNTATVTASGTSGVNLWGAQVEAGELTDYQKVVQAYDVTEAGVDSVPCLWFDGADDHFNLLASAASLSQNASMLTLAAACVITKNIATTQVAVSFATGTASGNARARLVATPTNLFSAGGRRLDADAYEDATTPIKTYNANSYSAVFDYAQALLSLRKNAVVAATDNPFQTAGNTSNTPSLAVYIARTASAYLGGFISGAVVIRNTTLTAAQLVQLERFLMNQIGVTA